MDGLGPRYQSLCDRIDAASRRAGRNPDEVTLVAVSKTFPLERPEALALMGHLDFGENKVQELTAKASARPDLRWHMIGHLQRNKAAHVVRHAATFHALDSLRLAAALDRRAEEAARVLPCFVQVNVSGEQSKFGIAPEALADFVDALAPYEHLEIGGLMTLAAAADDPEAVRPQFRRLRQLACSYDGRHPRARLERLSMGMSGDFEVAIEEGATHVRLGSAIFGARSVG